MVYCKRCETEVETYQEEPSGYLVCTSCGNILDQSAWSSEPTFFKEGGETTVAGHFVSNNAGVYGLGRMAGSRMYGPQYDSVEKTSGRARTEIEHLVELLNIRPRDEVCNSSHRLYMLAIAHNFTRGRRTAHIAAAAIYIICRQENHPFMLLDFADILQVNVFVLGSVFLQLCKILRLETHPILTRPVDPSLYLHRFADKLGFGKKMVKVTNLALRLISSMKRDWLQTGRRPAGVCGAALYIAGHIHGFQVTKKEVVRVVHVGESTLEKRVSEFACTEASAMTASEFEEQSRALELEQQRRRQTLELACLGAPPQQPLLLGGCDHVGKGEAVVALGMCKDCFASFEEVAGGIEADGSNPPAFEAAQRKADRLALEFDKEKEALKFLEGPESKVDARLDKEPSISDDEQATGKILTRSKNPAYVPKKRRTLRRKIPEEPASSPEMSEQAEDSAPVKRKRGRSRKQDAKVSFAEDGSQKKIQVKGFEERHASGHQATASSAAENQCRAIIQVNEANALQAQPQRQQSADIVKEELSDMSEGEDAYFHTAEEVKLKDIVWTAMNQDYIDKQALKAATQKQEEEEPPAAAEVGKRGRGRPKGSKSKPKPEDSLAPAGSAAEGVKAVLNARKLSKRVNYANIDDLFKDPDGPSPLPSEKIQASDPVSEEGDAVEGKPPLDLGKAEKERSPNVNSMPAQQRLLPKTGVRKHKPTIARRGLKKGEKPSARKLIGSVKEALLGEPQK